MLEFTFLIFRCINKIGRNVALVTLDARKACSEKQKHPDFCHQLQSQAITLSIYFSYIRCATCVPAGALMLGVGLLDFYS